MGCWALKSSPRVWWGRADCSRAHLGIPAALPTSGVSPRPENRLETCKAAAGIHFTKASEPGREGMDLPRTVRV